MLALCRPPEKKGRLRPTKVRWFILAVFTSLIVIYGVVCFAASAGDQPALTSKEKLWLKQHDGRIILAPTPNYPPVDFLDDRGRETGIAGDFMRLIQQKLGIRFKVVNLKTWSNIVEAAKRGEIDVTSIAAKTPGREKYWLFTKPYLTVRTVIISSNRIQGPLSLDTLQGMRVAVVKSYGVSEYIAEKHPDLQLISVRSDRAGIRSLAVGDLDAMIADLPTAAHIIDQEGFTNLRVAGETGYSYKYSIASRKDLPILNRILDKALASITPEERAAITSKWVGVRVVKPFDWRMAWIITSLVLVTVLTTLIWNVALRRRVKAQSQQLKDSNVDLRSILSALEESEQRYRTVFDSTAFAFNIFDLNGILVDANARSCEMYGYSHEEMVGMAAEELVDPDSWGAFRESLRTEHGEWFHSESVELRKDGSKFDSEVYVTRIHYLEKDQLLSVVSDVTERKLAREAMNTYADIVQNMQSGLYVYHLEDPDDDRTLRLVEANPASTVGLGIQKISPIGRYIDEVFPSLRDQGVPALFAETAMTGQPHSIDDFVYTDQNIELRHFSFRVFAIPGRRVGVLFEDISEEKQAEVEKRQFYRDTISSVTDGKLKIVEEADVERLIRQAELTIGIDSYEDTVIARQRVADYLGSMQIAEEDLHLFLIGMGEAMTNAIKHAGRGQVYAGTRGTSYWAGVADKGPGIAALALPKATLKRGHSSKVSMGMGYSIMLEATDHILLFTGPQGTTVILEKDLTGAKPQIRLEDLPDTW